MSRAVKEILNKTLPSASDLQKLCRPGLLFKLRKETAENAPWGQPEQDLATFLSSNPGAKKHVMGGMPLRDAVWALRRNTNTAEPPASYVPPVEILAYMNIHKDPLLAVERWTCMGYLDRIFLKTTKEFQSQLENARLLHYTLRTTHTDYDPLVHHTKKDNSHKGVLRKETDALNKSRIWRDKRVYETILYLMVRMGQGMHMADAARVLDETPYDEVSLCKGATVAQRVRALEIQQQLFQDPLTEDGEVVQFESLDEATFMKILLPRDSDAVANPRHVVSYAYSNNCSSLHVAEVEMAVASVADYNTDEYKKYLTVFSDASFDKFFESITAYDMDVLITSRASKSNPLDLFSRYTHFKSTLSGIAEDYLLAVWSAMSDTDRAEYGRVGYPSEAEWLAALGRLNTLNELPLGFDGYLETNQDLSIEECTRKWLKMTYIQRKDRSKCFKTGTTRKWREEVFPVGFLTNRAAHSLFPRLSVLKYATDAERIANLSDHPKFAEAYHKQTQDYVLQEYIANYLKRHAKLGHVYPTTLFKKLPDEITNFEPSKVRIVATNTDALAKDLYGSRFLSSLETVTLAASPSFSYLAYCEQQKVQPSWQGNAAIFLSLPTQVYSLAEDTRDTTYMATLEEVLDELPENGYRFEIAVEKLATLRHADDGRPLKTLNWNPYLGSNEGVFKIMEESIVHGSETAWTEGVPMNELASAIQTLNIDDVARHRVLSGLCVVQYDARGYETEGEKYFRSWVLRGGCKADVVGFLCRILWNNLPAENRRDFERFALYDAIPLKPGNLGTSTDLQFWWQSRGFGLVLAAAEVDSKKQTAFVAYALEKLGDISGLLVASRYLVWTYAAFPDDEKHHYEEVASNHTRDLSAFPSDLNPASYYTGTTPWHSVPLRDRWWCIIQARRANNRKTKQTKKKSLGWKEKPHNLLTSVDMFLTEAPNCKEAEWEFLAQHRKAHYEKQANIVMNGDWLTVDDLAGPTTALGVLLASSKAAYVGYQEVERIYYKKATQEMPQLKELEVEAMKNQEWVIMQQGGYEGGYPLISKKIDDLWKESKYIGARGLLQLLTSSNDQVMEWDVIQEETKVSLIKRQLERTGYVERCLRMGEGDWHTMSPQNALCAAFELNPADDLYPFSDVLEYFAYDMQINIDQAHNLLNMASDELWSTLGHRFAVYNKLVTALTGREVVEGEVDDGVYRSRVDAVLASDVSEEVRLRTLLVYAVKFSKDGNEFLYNYTVLPAQVLIHKLVDERGLKPVKNAPDHGDITPTEMATLTRVHDTTFPLDTRAHEGFKHWHPLTKDWHLPLFQHSTVTETHVFTLLDVYSVMPDTAGFIDDEIQRTWDGISPEDKQPYLELLGMLRKGFSRFSSEQLEAAAVQRKLTLLERVVYRIHRSLTGYNYSQRALPITYRTGTQVTTAVTKYKLLAERFSNVSTTEDMVQALLKLV